MLETLRRPFLFPSCARSSPKLRPEWKQPGLAAREKIDVLERDVPYMNDLLETPLVDELFALRPPTPVRFRKGWNHVAIRLPKKAKRLRASTGMTFCPIEGTSEHPREVVDFEYSAVDSSVRVSGCGAADSGMRGKVKKLLLEK